MKLFSFSVFLILFLSNGICAEEGGSKQRKVLRTSQMILEEIQKSPDQKIPLIERETIVSANKLWIYPNEYYHAERGD